MYIFIINIYKICRLGGIFVVNRKFDFFYPYTYLFCKPGKDSIDTFLCLPLVMSSLIQLNTILERPVKRNYVVLCPVQQPVIKTFPKLLLQK